MTTTVAGARDTTALAASCAVLREHRRFLLCTHEHPDGDALGSLVALQHALGALGKDAVAILGADELPLPYEYRFLRLGRVTTRLPEDAEQRALVVLDCGNASRTPAVEAIGLAPLVLNLDHHHDNTRFGSVNLVDPHASSTAEVLWRLLRALDVPLTCEIAEALYVGLVTDTGRFSYDNTGAEAHRMAAELHAAGIDVQAIYRELYENVPPQKLALLQLALSQLGQPSGGCPLTLVHLTAEDYALAGAEQTYAEGVVDHLRGLRGTAVAALVRDQLTDPEGTLKKVSLRAADERVDVSAIARTYGGGGHRRAAGFTTRVRIDTLAAELRAAVAAQLSAPRT